jgi:hypothetical protein
LLTKKTPPPCPCIKLTRISGSTNDSGIQSLEFLDTFRESKDLSRTNKSEIHRVPEQDNVLALVIREGDILELTVNDSGSSEGRSRLLDLSNYKIKRVNKYIQTKFKL